MKSLLSLIKRMTNIRFTRCVEVLEVPRSTYYQSLTKTVSKRDQENQQLTNRILEMYHGSKRRYGALKSIKLNKKKMCLLKIFREQNELN